MDKAWYSVILSILFRMELTNYILIDLYFANQTHLTN